MQRKWILALFFLAGISSLIYEIAWVRQATLTFGVSIYAYSAVLTAYMGGMALVVLGIHTPFALEGLSTVYAVVKASLKALIWTC